MRDARVANLLHTLVIQAATPLFPSTIRHRPGHTVWHTVAIRDAPRSVARCSSSHASSPLWARHAGQQRTHLVDDVLAPTVGVAWVDVFGVSTIHQPFILLSVRFGHDVANKDNGVLC